MHISSFTPLPCAPGPAMAQQPPLSAHRALLIITVPAPCGTEAAEPSSFLEDPSLQFFGTFPELNARHD